MKRENGTNQVQTYLDDELLMKIEKESDGEALSSTIRRIIKDYFKRKEQSASV